MLPAAAADGRAEAADAVVATREEQSAAAEWELLRWRRSGGFSTAAAEPSAAAPALLSPAAVL